MYRPHSLDQERSSWRTVIYFNVVRSIRHILSAVENVEDTFDDEFGNATDDANSFSASRSKGNGIDDQPSPSTSLLNGSITQSSPASGSITQESISHSTSLKESGATPIALLRLRLSHLVSMDSALADRLSGGVTVSGSGKGGVYVRSGWQSRTTESAKAKTKQPSTKQNQSAHGDIPYDPLVTDVARMLKSSEDDIRELWNHSVVKDLIAKRRLKLDEWSEL
jgi:hypothetical protein